MKKEIKNNLTNLVGEKTSDKILDDMFPPEVTGYKKGKILTLGQLKALPNNSIIHVYYIDEDDHVRANEFLKYVSDGADFYGTSDGFCFPFDNNEKDNTLIEKIDNCGWTFTIREAIKK
jgi:hypothetical protein